MTSRVKPKPAFIINIYSHPIAGYLHKTLLLDKYVFVSYKPSL
jgi:hypothetical protein